MYNLDEEKIECALGTEELCFWQGKNAQIVFFSDVWTRDIHLSLTIGTAKFKQLEYNHVLYSEVFLPLEHYPVI